MIHTIHEFNLYLKEVYVILRKNNIEPMNIY